MPGIGSLTATALLTVAGRPADFKNGREFAAYLGLVPRQYSTGGRSRLLGITKHGNSTVRTLLIHGVRAVLRSMKMGKTPFDDARITAWLNDLLGRRGYNRTLCGFSKQNGAWHGVNPGVAAPRQALRCCSPTHRGCQDKDDEAKRSDLLLKILSAEVVENTDETMRTGSADIPSGRWQPSLTPDIRLHPSSSASNLSLDSGAGAYTDESNRVQAKIYILTCTLLLAKQSYWLYKFNRLI